MKINVEEFIENPGFMKLCEEVAAARAKAAGVTLSDDFGLRNPRSDPNCGISVEQIQSLAFGRRLMK